MTEFTLKLRRGVTFHDGTLFNAEAVKQNFERSASLGRRAGNTVAETFGLISAIEFVGDDIVKLKLRVPNGQIEYWLGSTSGMMISPAAIKEGAFGGNLIAIGAGPYKPKSFEANVTTIMLRNDATGTARMAVQRDSSTTTCRMGVRG